MYHLRAFFLVAFVSFPSICYSSINLEAITSAVTRLCAADTNEASQFISITGDLESNLKVKFVGVDGKVSFKKEEWSGAQKVIKEHQLDENKDYRSCAIALAPIFITKFFEESKAKEIAKIKSEATKARQSKKEAKSSVPNVQTNTFNQSHTGTNGKQVGVINGDVTFN